MRNNILEIFLSTKDYPAFHDKETDVFAVLVFITVLLFQNIMVSINYFANVSQVVDYVIPDWVVTTVSCIFCFLF